MERLWVNDVFYISNSDILFVFSCVCEKQANEREFLMVVALWIPLTEHLWCSEFTKVVMKIREGVVCLNGDDCSLPHWLNISLIPLKIPWAPFPLIFFYVTMANCDRDESFVILFKSEITSINWAQSSKSSMLMKCPSTLVYRGSDWSLAWCPITVRGGFVIGFSFCVVINWVSFLSE